jgi:hypothetical protein
MTVDQSDRDLDDLYQVQNLEPFEKLIKQLSLTSRSVVTLEDFQYFISDLACPVCLSSAEELLIQFAHSSVGLLLKKSSKHPLENSCQSSNGK